MKDSFIIIPTYNLFFRFFANVVEYSTTLKSPTETFGVGVLSVFLFRLNSCFINITNLVCLVKQTPDVKSLVDSISPTQNIMRNTGRRLLCGAIFDTTFS